MRVFIGLIIAAIGTASTAATTGLSREQQLEQAYGEPGWGLLSYSDEIAVFAQVAKAGPATPNRPRAWVRYERIGNPVGGPPWKSSRSLQEFDCEQMRDRQLSYTSYSGQKLTGAVIGSTTTEYAGWDFTGPGTLIDAVLKAACP